MEDLLLALAIVLCLAGLVLWFTHVAVKLLY